MHIKMKCNRSVVWNPSTVKENPEQKLKRKEAGGRRRKERRITKASNEYLHSMHTHHISIRIELFETKSPTAAQTKLLFYTTKGDS